MPLTKLEEAIMKSWDKNTSSYPDEWSPANPGWGQSAVTALVVNDYVKGEIIWSNALLRDGRILDYYRNKSVFGEDWLAGNSFPESAVIPPGIEKKGAYSSTRDYLLSYSDISMSYMILKNRVRALMDIN